MSSSSEASWSLTAAYMALVPPVQDDLARLPAGGGGEGLLVIVTAEVVRDDGRDVESGLDHHRHGVPGLVHLAAVDALDRQHVEDDLIEVDRELLRRDA